LRFLYVRFVECNVESLLSVGTNKPNRVVVGKDEKSYGERLYDGCYVNKALSHFALYSGQRFLLSKHGRPINFSMDPSRFMR
jgi:hypothetical protein